MARSSILKNAQNENLNPSFLRIPMAVLVGFFIFGASFAQAELGDAFILCKHNKTVRSLRVDSKDDQCKAVYTKEGVDKIIGSSQKNEICGDVLDKVRKNLEENAWNCREVKESRLSNLGSEETP
jgi:hypothetical protein